MKNPSRWLALAILPTLISVEPWVASGASIPGEFSSIQLIDYAGFPQGWKIRGREDQVMEAYRIQRHGEELVLAADISGPPIRIFKKIPWNPFTHPILMWKWRVLVWPEDTQASVDFYVSLDRDLMGIPNITKFRYSSDEPVGKKEGGGFFRPNEVVIRSGDGQLGQWVTESINVLEEFRRMNRSDPAQEAVGLGFWVSSGVKAEISGVVALPP